MRVVLLKRKLTSFQIIIMAWCDHFRYLPLMLPFSSRSGLATPSLRHCLLPPQQSV